MVERVSLLDYDKVLEDRARNGHRHLDASPYCPTLFPDFLYLLPLFVSAREVKRIQFKSSIT